VKFSLKKDQTLNILKKKGNMLNEDLELAYHHPYYREDRHPYKGENRTNRCQKRKFPGQKLNARQIRFSGMGGSGEEKEERRGMG